MSDQLDPILQQAEQNRLKEQLFWRLGIAAGLIIIVLGGIWLLDRPDASQDVILPSTPRPAPTRIASTPASSPAASAPAMIASTITASEVIASAVAASSPAVTSEPTPIATPTSAPITPIAAVATEPPGVAPVTGRNAEAAPRYVPNAPLVNPTPTANVQPVATSPSKSTSNVLATPITPAIQNATRPTSAGGNKNPTRTEPALSLAPLYGTGATASATTPPAATSTTAARNFETHAVANGYAVQAGVFLHQSNADKMLRQLQNAGVPAYLETRVQIGPFKTKAEADAAIKKLRALGIEPVVHTAD